MCKRPALLLPPPSLFYHQQQQCDFFKTTAITKSGLSEHLCEWLKFKVIDGRITFFVLSILNF